MVLKTETFVWMTTMVSGCGDDINVQKYWVGIFRFCKSAQPLSSNLRFWCKAIFVIEMDLLFEMVESLYA